MTNYYLNKQLKQLIEQEEYEECEVSEDEELIALTQFNNNIEGKI